MHNIPQLAKEYLDYFCTKDGEVYLKDDAPPELSNLVYKAHDGMLPDNYRYQFILDALGYIANAEDNEDIEDVIYSVSVDSYANEVYDWLTSHAYREGYVDQYFEEYGYSKSMKLADYVLAGMHLELEEVVNIVLDGLREIAEEK